MESQTEVRQTRRREATEADRALEDLLLRVSAQDREALASLYDLTHARVHGMALRVLRDPTAAEDVVCEVYLQVWRTAATFDPRQGCVWTWLTVLTRSRALDRVRVSRRVARREEALPEVEPAGLGPSPEQSAEAGERSRLVRDALERLPREQRQLIELAYFAGLSHSELATRLGQPLGTVKTRIRSGMMGLRTHLAALAPEPVA